MDIREAKHQVIQAGLELTRSGLISRTWGNVSCRVSEERFVITASGRNYKTLTQDEVIPVGISDLSYEGDMKPSSEYKIHRAVYQLKREAGFIIHTHQDNASAASAAGMDCIEFDKEYEGIGSRIFCAKYALSGTDELCSHAAEALKQSRGNAVLLRNHGAVCFGRTYGEAFAAARSLEEACGVYLEKLDPRIISSNKGDIMQKGRRIVWNKTKVLLEFAKKESFMRPYLDDFAQIAGMEIRVLPRDQKAAEEAVGNGESVLVKGVGAFCTADTLQDTRALSTIMEKNAMAYFAAQAGAGKPLDEQDCKVMRKKYLEYYSHLAEGKLP